MASVGGPTSRYEFVDLNNARPPFDKLEMRQAVSWVTDRQAIVDLVLLGRGEPLFGGPIGPASNPFYNGLDTFKTAPDLAKARELMAAAGYPDGVEIQGFADAGSRFADTLEVLQQQWAEIGVRIVVNALEAGAVRDRRNNGDYDIVINGWGTLIDPHDFTGENFYTTGGLNFGKSGDATLDAMLDEGIRTADLAARKAIYRRQEEYILNTVVPYVFLYRPFEYAVFQKAVKGLKHEAARTRISLQDTWIERT